MTLAEYLKETGESQRAFAKRSGVPLSTVNRLFNGLDARGRAWDRIMRATGRRVTPCDSFLGRDRCAASSAS